MRRFLVFQLFTTLVFIKSEDELEKNAVVGEPTISCAADAIYVKLRTKSTFLGHVDVKFTPDRSCFQSLVTNNQIEILIPHEECRIERRRSFHPKGIVLETKLAVSFHPEFTTIDDRIFNVVCFHQKNGNETIASNELTIGSPSLPLLASNKSSQTVVAAPPSCNYRIQSYPNGPSSNRLTLGENVFHVWKCENIYESCIIVENCHLIGGDEKHSVIDSEGCSKSDQIMPQIQYHNKTFASASVKVFGISHTSIIYFSCQVRLHPQQPSGVCPTPICDEAERRKKRSATQQFPVIEVRTQNLEISQLINAYEKNVETERVELDLDLLKTEPAGKVDPHICASFQSIIVALAALALTCITMTTIIVFRIARRREYEITNMT